MLLGSAVNDSGAIVGGVAMFVLVASLAWLALENVAGSSAPAVTAAPPAAEAADDAAGADQPMPVAATTTEDPSTEAPARAGAEPT